jgi:SPP1 gp7 family putative phage head morphogenesis protein
MAAKTSAQRAWEVASKYEPKLAAALQKALADFKGKASAARIEAYIISGDLTGLAHYLLGAFGASVGPIVAVLDQAVIDAGVAAAAEINASLKPFGVNVRTQLPFPTDVPAGIVFQGVTPEFAYNPVNPKTISAVRTWQGNLIQQMSANARAVVMDNISAGLVAGDNPRTIARAVRNGLPLTRSQNRAVQNFDADLKRIIDRGISSAQSWGIYTPRQIAELKLADPKTYKRLNFTNTEVSQGRRWAKISRAAGTLQFDPKTGIKASKPVGFVAPPGTQGGENAYRLTADGKPVDAMTQWRLRDKRFDPKIYAVVEAEEKLGDARRGLSAARTGPEKTAAGKALAKAQAAKEEALRGLEAARGEMVEGYNSRMVKHRSQVIARTESLRAANLGSYEAWRQAMQDSDLFEPNELRRVWITAKDDRVRMTHRVAEGQKTGIDEPFKVDGIGVMFPPTGPNCRCTVGYEANLGGFPAGT